MLDQLGVSLIYSGVMLGGWGIYLAVRDWLDRRKVTQSE